MSQYSTPNRTITAENGVTYAYRRYGKAGTTPVLFLHHFRGNLDNWDPALVDDIAAEREVLLFDTSGVAGTNGPNATTFARAGQDALAFVDALGLAEIDVFGFSIGGFVAQEIALQRPGLIRRLILAATGPEGGYQMERWAPTPNFHAMKDIQDADDVLALFFAPSETSRAKGREFVGRIFTRTEGRDAAVSLETRDAQVTAIQQWGVPDRTKYDRLERITVPTLVANGENDVMIPLENSTILAERIPSARLLIYPDANHGFLFQYPHEFAAEVNTFLGR